MPGRNALLRRVFFALLFVPYTCVFPYIAPVNNPNENVRMYATMALVEEATLRIDTMMFRYGWVNDMARVPDRDGHGNHYFSVKGPAVTYAGVPFYWAFAMIAPHFGHPLPADETRAPMREWWMRSATLLLRLVVVQLPCFAFLVWFERWLRKTTADPVLRFSAVAAMGLGTNYLAYALMFVSHALTAAVTFVAFALVTDELERPEPERRRSRALLVGFLAGLATMLEYHALVLSVGLTIYALFAFRRWGQRGAYVLGGSVDAVVVMFYQWRCFGNPLTPGYKDAENEGFAEWHRQGLYGIGKPSWAVFRDLSFHQTFGFFTTSRFMALAGLALPFVLTAGIRDPGKRRMARTNAVWVAMMVVLWVAISGALNWRGGWTVGPRFFAAAPPFFTFGALCALETFAERGDRARALARGVVGGMAVAGVCTLGLVGLVYNSIPEEIVHPMAEFALPLARNGFVPHHAAELVGWRSPTFWYVAFGCAVGAAIAAASWPVRDGADRGRNGAVRAATAVLVFAGCMVAEAVTARPRVPGPASEALANFVHAWEPPERDYLTRLRARVVIDGRREPCLVYALVKKERGLGLFVEADNDAAHATVPASSCR
jgi:hypothetical protein